MNMKKIISGLMAATLVASFASAAAFAAAPINSKAVTAELSGIDASTDVVNSDNNPYSNASFSGGKLTIDGITPNSTLYIRLPAMDQTVGDGSIVASDLRDSKLFSFKSDKKTNTKLVKSIDFESQKLVGGVRADWIKIVLNDSTMTSEQKFEGYATFKAKKSTNDNADNNGFSAATNVMTGDTLRIDFSFWINNKGETNGANPGAGDRIYFEPEENEENTLIWGDNMASLKFDANDGANKFYARLSMKADAAIYAEFGDPQGAELFFFDFVGNPSIPATSRATLTLGIPWDTDVDNAPNPAKCFIYLKDSDGLLTDVTDDFTYSEDNEEIEGWSTRTRTLGTYILSDIELDLDTEVTDAPISSTSSSKPAGGKDIPNTGASDMVGVAVIAAVVSLAAAGAVAFKKVAK